MVFVLFDEIQQTMSTVVGTIDLLLGLLQFPLTYLLQIEVVWFQIFQYRLWSL